MSWRRKKNIEQDWEETSLSGYYQAHQKFPGGTIMYVRHYGILKHCRDAVLLYKDEEVFMKRATWDGIEYYLNKKYFKLT